MSSEVQICLGEMDPVLSHLRVPCLCSPSDFVGPFATFPARQGFDIAALKQTKKDSPQEPVYATLLQTWLCFGLISDVCQMCGVPFDPSDLITEDDNGQLLLSYARVERYIWYWISTEYHRTLDERRKNQVAYLENLKCASQIVNLRNEALSSSMVDTVEDVVLLSIMTIVDYLLHNTANIFNLAPPGFKIRWQRSRYLDKHLQKAGWCKGELPGLYTECLPTTLLYLSTLNRARSDKQHDNCTAKMCLVNQIDPKTYKPLHATDCTDVGCRIIESPVQEVSDILISDRVPLVYVIETPQGPEIKTASFSFGDPDHRPNFTAISHVWSDGMGNPKVNGLHACQLKRIQRRVSALYPDTFTNCYFWMDTLCVPLNPDVRALAIVRMAKTFAHASKVLVLDTWLESWDAPKDPRQLLVRIAKCDWNTRLWTFNELVLARECRFQLSSQSTTIDELNDHTQLTQNVQRVSNQLSLLSEADLVRQKHAMILLKVITHVDQSMVDSMRHYAELPRQDDEAEEELRVHAMEFFRISGDPFRLQNMWRPKIARLGSVFASLSVDLSLRTHIAAVITDPILSYGMTALFRLRGTYYPASLDRSKDLEGPGTRQIQGFDSFPHVLFTDVGPGLQFRMTSRQEDETICLGGFLGMDVSPMVNIRIDQEKRAEQVAAVSADRMAIFLELMGTISPSILFSNIPRLQKPGFCWAPETFLNPSISIRRGFGTFASITKSGIQGSFSGVRLPDLSFGSVCRRGQIHITYLDRETRKSTQEMYPFRRSWAHAKLHLEFYTPSSHDLGRTQDFVLVVNEDSVQDQNGFLAVVVEEDATTLRVRYLMHASRMESLEKEGLDTASEVWFRSRTLCIV